MVYRSRLPTNEMQECTGSSVEGVGVGTCVGWSVMLPVGTYVGAAVGAEVGLSEGIHVTFVGASCKQDLVESQDR